MTAPTHTTTETLPTVTEAVDDLPAICLIRFQTDAHKPSWGYWQNNTLHSVSDRLTDITSLSLEDARRLCESATETIDTSRATILPPVDDQEVWASGVTYERSLEARLVESNGERLYKDIYESERPELFFKSVSHRVVGHGGNVGIRADSDWNTPEPELALYVSSDMRIFGAASSNDMSSRSIEGENALYLPQAKCYEKSCSVGPGVVPMWALPGRELRLSMTIDRNDERRFQESISTARLTRTWEDLVSWLGRGVIFPTGAVLMTGTGITPPTEFTLAPGDIIAITIESIGTLRNTVEEIDPLALGRITPIELPKLAE